MKKLFLFTVMLTILSCDSPTDFRGFGGFDIGATFSSLPSYEAFTKIMEDDFNVNSYELSDKIGLVSDLNITTKDNKIIEVRFLSNEQTNITEIEKIYKEVFQKGKEHKMENEFISIKAYQTADENIFFADIEHKTEKLKNGQPQHEYKYSNKEAKKQNAALIKKISINH